MSELGIEEATFGNGIHNMVSQNRLVLVHISFILLINHEYYSEKECSRNENETATNTLSRQQKYLCRYRHILLLCAPTPTSFFKFDAFAFLGPDSASGLRTSPLKSTTTAPMLITPR